MGLATTRFDVAAPFLASALMVFLGSFAVLAIVSRLERVYTDWQEEVEGDEGDSALQPPLINDAKQTAQTAIWAIDASQILGLFLGPVAGLMILHPPIGSRLAILYIVAIVASICGFLGFTFKASVDRYWTKGLGIFSPVSIFGVVASLVAAAIAAAIGP